jgi:hypothetical protein
VRPALACALGAWALACSPLPVGVTIEPGTVEAPRIVALLPPTGSPQVSVLDPTALPSALPTLTDVGADEPVEVVVLTLDAPLGELGLVPGDYRESSKDPRGVTLGALSARTRLEHTTVLGGQVPPFEPLPTLPALLRDFRVPSKVPCGRVTPQPLPDLPNGATFAVALGPARVLVGSRSVVGEPVLHVVEPGGVVRGLRFALPTEPADLNPAYLYAMGALPVSGTDDEVWLSMRFGELWRVRLPADEALVTPLERVVTGLDEGLGFVAGVATANRISLYGLAVGGPVVHYDGTRTRTLTTFPELSYFSGGILVEEPRVYAVRASSLEVQRIEDGLPVPLPVPGAREGLVAVARVPMLGVVVADGRGHLYVERGDRFEDVVDVGLGTGAQAIIPTPTGLWAAGGAGALRQWRLEGGLCAMGAPQISQTLRYWARADVGPPGAAAGDTWVATGPTRDGPGMIKAPLTLFTFGP